MQKDRLELASSSRPRTTSHHRLADFGSSIRRRVADGAHAVLPLRHSHGRGMSLPGITIRDASTAEILIQVAIA